MVAMKIAVAGAGAMGGRFGYMLWKAGYDVTLIDQWVPHVEAIREHGFRINLDGEEICAAFLIADNALFIKFCAAFVTMLLPL